MFKIVILFLMTSLLFMEPVYAISKHASIFLKYWQDDFNLEYNLKPELTNNRMIVDKYLCGYKYKNALETSLKIIEKDDP